MKANRSLPVILLALSAMCLVACQEPGKSESSSEPASSLSSTSSEESAPLPSESSSESSESSIPQNPVTVSFETGDEECLVEDIVVEEGSTIAKPYPVRQGYALRRWLLKGEEFDFSTPINESIALVAEWVERTNLPTMIIELRDADSAVVPIDSVTRETYVSSRISLVNEEGSFDQKDTPSSFKGRGNGSWMDSKKGWKIKFDKKQSLFGRTANKHWVLLACTNFNDTTMLRNFTAYNMAGALFSNLEYTTNAVWLDLFVNGEYRGVYVLCEHVRVGKGRVDIASEYGVEDTGYLVEYDAYADSTRGVEGIDYFDITDSGPVDPNADPYPAGGENSGGGDNPFPGGGFPGGKIHRMADGGDGFPGGGDNPGDGGFPGGGDNPGGGGFPGGGGNEDPFGGVDISVHPHEGIVRYNFSVHSPDPEDYVSDGKISEEQYRAQVAFIKEYVKQVYTAAITDNDFAAFSNLTDVASLVDLYILNELYKNTDAGYSSFYMYKKAGGKLFFGPAWDFDGTTTAARGDETTPTASMSQAAVPTRATANFWSPCIKQAGSVRSSMRAGSSLPRESKIITTTYSPLPSIAKTAKPSARTSSVGVRAAASPVKAL